VGREFLVELLERLCKGMAIMNATANTAWQQNKA
jgi:hypothetical protein